MSPLFFALLHWLRENPEGEGRGLRKQRPSLSTEPAHQPRQQESRRGTKALLGERRGGGRLTNFCFGKCHRRQPRHLFTASSLTSYPTGRPFSWLSASTHLPLSLQATKSAQWGLLCVSAPSHSLATGDGCRMGSSRWEGCQAPRRGAIRAHCC